MKIVNFNSQDVILSAVSKYIDFISPTYGPAGKSILIADDHSVKAVDDGKIASQDFELVDEHENAVVKYIREVTLKTDDRVGDGTTTSAILMADIVKQLLTFKEFEDPKNLYGESLKLQKAAVEAVKQIKKASKQIKTKAELYDVAYNSFNNKEMATLISETLFKIGKDGTIAVEDSRGMTTESEVVTGLEIEKGYTSPYFATKENEAILTNPYVVIVNKKIEFFNEIVPVIKLILQSGKKDFILIADGFSEEVIGKSIVSKMQDAFHPILIDAPGFGEDKTQSLLDIAAVVGATVIDPKAGHKLEEITLEMIGEADSVTSKKDITIILGGKGTKEVIKSRVGILKSQLSQATSKYEREKIEKKIAKIQGGVAVIKVGAPTENEQKTIKAKVDDAVNATKVAYREGIVLGGGKTFESIKTSSDVLNNALKAPRRQLELNGKESLDEKVYDPTEVLVASLESAVSIACGLIQMGGIIATKRKKEDRQTYDY